MSQVNNPLVVDTDVFFRLHELLAQIPDGAGFNTGGRLVVGEETINLSPHGAWVLATLVSATPEDVGQVEQLLTRADTSDEAKMVSPERASALLGVSRPTVVRWASEGLLVNYRVGTHHRYARKDVENLRDSRREAAENARLAARSQRAQLVEAGTNLDVEPTQTELIAAGRALRSYHPEDAASTLVRARRADVNAASAAAGSPEVTS
jgi:excisionase family DNA binding protein